MVDFTTLHPIDFDRNLFNFLVVLYAGIVFCTVCNTDLENIHFFNHSFFYVFFFQAFSVVFHKAIERAEPADEVKERVKNLINSITYSIYMYTTRGLFERDKLIFTSQVTFQVHTCTSTVRSYFKEDSSEFSFFVFFNTVFPLLTLVLIVARSLSKQCITLHKK